MWMSADLRVMDVSEAPDAIAAAETAASVRRDADIDLARRVLEIDRARAYVPHGFGSTRHFARTRLGLESGETRRLLALARALEMDASLERRVRGAELTVPAVAAVVPVLSHPEIGDEPSEWLDLASREPITTVRQHARRRLAEVRCGEPVVDVTVSVPESTREGYERARELASAKAGRWLSRCETFEALVDHYLDTFDPARESSGTRRVGPTSERPGDRYIPISVRRAIRRRAGDRCEYPGCFHRVRLFFCHVTPHAEGSPREENDLFLGCWTHHFETDAGCIQPLWQDGDLVFVDAAGRCVSPARPGGYRPETALERAAIAALQESGGDGFGAAGGQVSDTVATYGLSERGCCTSSRRVPALAARAPP